MREKNPQMYSLFSEIAIIGQLDESLLQLLQDLWLEKYNTQIEKFDSFFFELISKKFIFEENGILFVPDQIRKVFLWISQEIPISQDIASSSLISYFETVAKKKGEISLIRRQCDALLLEVRDGSQSKNFYSLVKPEVCFFCGTAHNGDTALEKPLTFYLSALEKVRKIDEKPFNIASLLLKIGDIYRRTKQPQKALEYLFEALEITEKRVNNQPHMQVSLLHFAIGITYYDLEELEKSIEHHLKSVSLKRELKCDEKYPKLMLESLDELAKTYYAKDDQENLLKYSSEYSDLYKKTNGDTPSTEAATNLLHVASVLSLKKDFRNSLSYRLRALSMFKAKGASLDILLQQVESIVDINILLEDWAGTLEFLNQKLELFKQKSDQKPTVEMVNLLIGMAALSENVDEKRVLEYFNQALEIAEKLAEPEKSKNLAAVLYNIARWHHTCKDFEKSFEYAQQAVDVGRKIYGKHPYPDFLPLLEYVARILGKKDLNKSLDALLQALEIRKSLTKNQPSVEVANLLFSISDVFLQLQDLHSAQKFLLEFVEVNNLLGGAPQPVFALALSNIGGIYHTNNEYDKALEFYLKAVKLHKDLNLQTDRILQLHNSIAVLFNAKKEYAKAIEHWGEFCSISKQNPSTYETPEHIMALRQIAFAYKLLREKDKVFPYVFEAFEIMKRLCKGNPTYEFATFTLNIGEMLAADKQNEKALFYYKEAVNTTKSIYEKDPTSAKQIVLLALSNLTKIHKIYGVSEDFIMEVQKLMPDLIDSLNEH